MLSSVFVTFKFCLTTTWSLNLPILYSIWICIKGHVQHQYCYHECSIIGHNFSWAFIDRNIALETQKPELPAVRKQGGREQPRSRVSGRSTGSVVIPTACRWDVCKEVSKALSGNVKWLWPCLLTEQHELLEVLCRASAQAITVVSLMLRLLSRWRCAVFRKQNRKRFRSLVVSWLWNGRVCDWVAP